jgi:diguanylate cyclase (GGDEF)-like protein
MLPNRRYLGEWLSISRALASRRGQQFVLLFVDLDGFKSVNGCLGHETGDRVLQVTAARLRQALRRSDFVARLGGDEFVAVLPDAQTAPGLSVLIGRLQAEIAKAPVAEIEDGAGGASIGAAWFPTEGDTVDALLAAADHAIVRSQAESSDLGDPAAGKRREWSGGERGQPRYSVTRFANP